MKKILAGLVLAAFGLPLLFFLWPAFLFIASIVALAWAIGVFAGDF